MAAVPLIGVIAMLVELECWDEDKAQVVDRTARSWDNPDRRPSHADRRLKIAREMLRNRFWAELPQDHQTPKTIALRDELVALAPLVRLLLGTESADCADFRRMKIVDS